jgi:hypothetical protein
MAFETVADLVQNLPKFIDNVYNARKLHSALGYVVPRNLRSNTPGRRSIQRPKPVRPEGLTPDRAPSSEPMHILPSPEPPCAVGSPHPQALAAVLRPGPSLRSGMGTKAHYVAGLEPDHLMDGANAPTPAPRMPEVPKSAHLQRPYS